METPESPNEPLDNDQAVQIMGALASPVRLELLLLLRTPMTLREIRIQPRRGPGGRDRAMSHVVVRRHLERLLQIGVIQTQIGERDGRRVTLFGADEAKAIALIDWLRRFAFPGKPIQTTDSLAARFISAHDLG